MDSLVRILASCFSSLTSTMLWSYKDLIDIGKASLTAEDEHGVAGDSADRPEEAVIQTILNKRERIISAAVLCMDIPTVDTLSMQIQLEGFRTVSIVRSFFPMKEAGFKTIDCLAYSPDQKVLNSLRKVFESSRQRIYSDFHEMENGGNDLAMSGSDDPAAKVLLEKLLWPLSKSLVFDLSNINRRQAAAVIVHLMDPNEQVQEAIKLIVKRLRDGDVVKFLEITLVALKGMYQDEILALGESLETAISQEDEHFDFNQNENLQNDGYNKLFQFSKRLSSSLGVGKVKGNVLAALQGFIYTAIDFALSDQRNIGFVHILHNFVRFLSDRDMNAVHRYLEDAMQSKTDILKLLESPETRTYPGVTCFLNFATNLQSKLSGVLGGVSSIALKRSLPVKSAKLLSTQSDQPSMLSTNLVDNGGGSANNEDIGDFSQRSTYQPPILGLKKSSAFSKIPPPFATGLDLEDISDYGDDENQDAVPSRKRPGSSFEDGDDFESGRKKQRNYFLFGNDKRGSNSPFNIESSPIDKDDLDELDNIPSRRRLM